MNFRTILALFGGLSTLTRFDAVNADAAQPPLRMRVNTDLLKNLVHLRDQEFFQVFANIDSENVKAPLGSLNWTVGPKSGSVDDFDFDVNMSKEDFGISSDNMKVTGKGTLADGAEFTFSAPFKAAKLSYELGK